MKKIRVLIYCYDFPPLSTVGSNRPYAWATHLHEFDICSVVLTRKWKEGIESPEEYFLNDIGEIERIKSEKGEIIRIPYKKRLKDYLVNIPYVGLLARKTITVIELLFRWDLSFCDEKRFLEKALNELLEKESFDIIIVTGEPFILFKHVMKTKTKFGIPFILDYRDRWWYNERLEFKKTGIIENFISKLEEREEEKIMSKSSGFIFVFDRLRQIYQDKFSNIQGHTVENGIDLNLLKEAQLLPSPFPINKFTIVYTGILYPNHKFELFIKSLLKVVERLPDIEKKAIECVFIGSLYHQSMNTIFLEKFADKHPKRIKLIPRVSHSEALSYQLNAQVLLKFSMDSQKKMGIGAKLSEYAATKNPILTVISVPDKETPFFPGRNIQTICSEQEEIEQFISFQFEQWKQGKSLKTDITDDEIYHMSRRYQTEQLARVIKSTLA